ncbi:inactive TPR repeat-containing thioredoxin TTL3-like [Hibiscus syriacus]|uniref:inactive TPR repeat-containing thioredoxin TTL3-like n=1 Tax=Hibiscus syriacus TaxID=106335 RepID=UPI0019216812|nr:inactive TPR repeat-containing thioredoxin TTL3-like [Hibiscus syriacus]
MGAIYEKKSKSGGGGLWGSFFGRCRFWPRRKSISSSSFMKSPQNHSKFIVVQQQNKVYKPAPAPVESTRTITAMTQRVVPKDAVSISGELESMIEDYQKVKGRGNLVRASSGNFMMYGHLGNLRQPAIGGNKKEKKEVEEIGEPGSLCRALSKRRSPETLKFLGDEEFKHGKFGEALNLYEAAIAIEPFKASYRTDRSAALEASGRFLEALFECKEAIRLEPRYLRAHHRLASLYIRLGEVENAMYHFKRAGTEAGNGDMARAKILQQHVNKCTEAKMQRNWKALLKETDAAIKAGADSAPHLYALKAEALMKLHRHQEANEALLAAPKLNDDVFIKCFGPICKAIILVVQAQVDMAFGRFDDAVAATERAVRLDSKSKETSSAMSKAKALATAQMIGDEHFKASNFYDACITYGEGLRHDPRNSVLLFSRAVCYANLGQIELAVGDCTHALSVRPGYSEARLKRAECNSKLGRWKASLEDYEVLRQENPNNEEVKQGLSEARRQLNIPETPPKKEEAKQDLLEARRQLKKKETYEELKQSLSENRRQVKKNGTPSLPKPYRQLKKKEPSDSEDMKWVLSEARRLLKKKETQDSEKTKQNVFDAQRHSQR